MCKVIGLVPTMRWPLKLSAQAAASACSLLSLSTAGKCRWCHARVFLQGLHLRQRNIAGGRVDVEHAGQNQLHGAALGAHHEVYACQVALKGAVELWVLTSNTRVMDAKPRLNSTRLSAAVRGRDHR